MSGSFPQLTVEATREGRASGAIVVDYRLRGTYVCDFLYRGAEHQPCLIEARLSLQPAFVQGCGPGYLRYLMQRVRARDIAHERFGDVEWTAWMASGGSLELLIEAPPFSAFLACNPEEPRGKYLALMGGVAPKVAKFLRLEVLRDSAHAGFILNEVEPDSMDTTVQAAFRTDSGTFLPFDFTTTQGVFTLTLHGRTPEGASTLFKPEFLSLFGPVDTHFNEDVYTFSNNGIPEQFSCPIEKLDHLKLGRLKPQKSPYANDAAASLRKP